MAFVLKNTKIYIEGYDLSGIYNNVNVNFAGELKDKTSFGSSARKRIPGLFSVDISGQGFHDASSQYSGDKTQWDSVASTGEVFSVVPQGTGLGNIAYSANKLSYEYNPSFQIGEIASINFACYGDGPLVRQRVMESGSISTALSATVRNIGLRAPLENLYVAYHNITGTTAAGEAIVVKVQTASSSGFSSTTLSTALKLTSVTTTPHTAQWKSTQHSTAHTWYRVSVASSGTTDGSINGILLLGIR